MSCFPFISIAYQQEYVGGEQPAAPTQQQNNSSNPPINIFVTPKTNPQPAIAPQVATQTPPPAPVASTAAAPETPINNTPQQNTPIQTAQAGTAVSPPQPQALPQATNTASTPSNVYTSEEQAAWFKNCLSAVKDNKVSAYANAFCQCGWNKISGGALPANYLTSTNPQDTQMANTILRVISQECLAESMVNKG
jgi:hypothetical protein